MSDLSNEQDALEMLMRVTECIVDKPEKMTVAGFVTDFGTTFKVTPDLSDIGKLIGKQGRMARTLRHLLLAVGQKHHTRYELEIVDPKTLLAVAVNHEEANHA